MKSSSPFKHFLFVGNRLEVLNAMFGLCPKLTLCVQANTYAANTLQNQLTDEQKAHYYEFSNKKDLLCLIQSFDFDVLVSNGCPYILPISKLVQNNAVFVNCHPSLLPNLKGKHPINGAILYNQPSGATCHIMTDEIDSGEIISQVPVYNDTSIPLSLLYQMCFLAEKEAFKIAFKRNFKPLESLNINSKPNISYYTRQEEHLTLDFATQTTQEIIHTIKAFANPNQGAYLSNYKNISFKDALLLKNKFLSDNFRESAINDVLLQYENHLLCKRKEGFLQLTMAGDIKTLPSNLSCINNTINVINNHINTPCVFSSKGYIKALLERGRKPFEFSFTQGNQAFCNTAIIEPIPNTSYFDMSTPYGYGGYISNTSSSSFLHDALKAQEEEARKHNIIAEFIRFHPLFPFTRYFAPLLDFFNKERDIAITHTDPHIRHKHYSPRLRNKLRKSNALLSINQSKDLNAFIALYSKTMERNRADSFYFFSSSYFETLLSMPQTLMLEARYKGEIVSMGIFLFDNLCGYYHLGANAPLSLESNLNAMGALFEAFFDKARQKGLNSCILGGGRSKNNQDSLLNFKKQFATSIMPFYIGGYIYDKAAYNTITENSKNIPFFLSYRFNKNALKTMGGGGRTYHNFKTYPFYIYQYFFYFPIDNGKSLCLN